jgi:hypothetical protein
MSLNALISILLLAFNSSADMHRAALMTAQPDSVWENQILYNGRLWRNLFQRVHGDQFLFTGDPIHADVSVRGRKFPGVPVRYDIYNDELLARTNTGLIIRLNTELVDSFSFDYNNNRYDFVRIDSARNYSGFVNEIYSGASTIHVKYRKLIELLAIDRKQDRFYDVKKFYLIRNGREDQFKRKADLLRLLGDRKKELKEYIRKNKLVVRKDYVFSFVPVIEYYDRLTAGGKE